MEDLIIVGGGGHACSLYSNLVNDHVPILGYVSDKDSVEFKKLGVSYLGDDNVLIDLKLENNLIMGIGFSSKKLTRQNLIHKIENLGFNIAGFTSSNSTLSTLTDIHPSTQILSGAYIGPFTQISRHCLINTGAIVEHHVHLDEGVHVAPGAVICGGVKVGKNVQIGANSTILPNVVIKDNSIIGAGSVLTSSADSNSIYAGVPARRMN